MKTPIISEPMPDISKLPERTCHIFGVLKSADRSLWTTEYTFINGFQLLNLCCAASGMEELFISKFTLETNISQKHDEI